MFYKQCYQITSPYGPRTANGVSEVHKGVYDSTIQYFEFYRYGNDLMLKLAKVLI